MEDRQQFLNNPIRHPDRNAFKDQIYHLRQQIFNDENNLVRIKKLPSEIKNIAAKNQEIFNNIKQIEASSIYDSNTLTNAANKVEFLKEKVHNLFSKIGNEFFKIKSD